MRRLTFFLVCTVFTSPNSSPFSLDLGIRREKPQIIDGLDPEYKKRFMHHYNFLNTLQEQVVMVRLVVEIGHGALGERALALKSCLVWKNFHTRFAW